ncbi:hypothetical protein FB451DRAFT_1385704 [Mycena latifolia]|nr:hypothetical protein FB451DRAFT_1385704 [Mycena latifolia]
MVQSTIDFYAQAVNATDPEMIEEVAKRVDPVLMASDGPMLRLQDAAAIAGDDEEAEIVLQKMNARKTVEELQRWEPNFRGETFSGFSIVPERGNLGLHIAVA